MIPAQPGLTGIPQHLPMPGSANPLRSIPNLQPAATQFRRTGDYLCIFFVLCFSLGFFFNGVLVGVGEGVPEGSGVGDGRTRG